jgi:hypothetical protein
MRELIDDRGDSNNNTHVPTRRHPQRISLQRPEHELHSLNEHQLYMHNRRAQRHAMRDHNKLRCYTCLQLQHRHPQRNQLHHPD